TQALHRDPKQRFDNIAALREALYAGGGTASPPEAKYVLWIRFLPSAFRWSNEQEQEDDELLASLEATLLDELNKAAAVRLLPDDGRNANRIQLETSGHRLVVDVDSAFRDHLVVIGASVKRFSLDGLYREDAWVANAEFRPIGFNHARIRNEARSAVAAF